GSAELVGPLARLGAWFGFPGYFLHGRKARQREVFRRVPRDRLLVETDAPDQRLPREPEWREMGGPDGGGAVADWEPLELEGLEGRPLNHPANLGLVYSGLAEVLGVPVSTLVESVRSGFERLFEG
ncbi:MAG: TatD family hydrolase, partial [Planctomycetota bacterium]|nr:TatD family hydrolase [Planctomycetota bacterium]